MELPDHLDTLEALSYIEGILRMVETYRDPLPLQLLIQDPQMEEIITKHFGFHNGSEFLRAFTSADSFHRILDDRFSGCSLLFHTRKHRGAHSLPNTHLLHCIRGSCVVQIEQGDPLYLHKGDTCVVRSGVSHAYYNLSETSLVLHAALTDAFVGNVLLPRLPQNYLQVSFFRNIVFQKQDSCTHLFVQDASAGEISYFLTSAFYHNLYRPPMYEELVNGFMLLFFTHLLQAMGQEQSPERAISAEQTLQQLQAYIAANCRTVTLRELAEQFHFNESYLSQYLKKNTGETFTSLLQNARLSAASKLLISTTLSVVDIADKVGYQNMSYFYRLFSKVNQCSPAEYRARFLRSGRRVIGSESI